MFTSNIIVIISNIIYITLDLCDKMCYTIAILFGEVIFMENEVINKFNFTLNKLEELFYTLLLKKFTKLELESMNLTNYIFEIKKMYPNEEKALNLLIYVYFEDTDNIATKTYDLMNLYDYLKGALHD